MGVLLAVGVEIIKIASQPRRHLVPLERAGRGLAFVVGIICSS